MTGNRDNFSEEVRRALRERVGGLCSRPECGKVTVVPNAGDAKRVDITGRAAHITAAHEGGPRFDPSLTPTQRAGADNGIWLCADCADLVDKKKGSDFSVQQLRSWKRNAEERQLTSGRLRARVRRPSWLDKLRTPHYINVPRLLHLVGSDALSASTLASLDRGFPKSRNIIRELVEVEQALRKLTIEAVDVQEIDDPSNQLVEGLVVSYHRQIRTKNGDSTDPNDVRTFSAKSSPYIYLDCRGYRYIQPYDPIWLTTNTAHGTVRRGMCKLAGIAIIKSVDHRNKQVMATPLTFGIPDMFGFYDP